MTRSEAVKAFFIKSVLPVAAAWRCLRSTSFWVE